MRLSSVTEVFAGRSGSGYVLAPDLVLTAAHVLVDGHAISVRPLGATDWVDADVVWRGSGDVDAVLLRARAPADPALKFGTVGPREQIACRATGFPAVAQLPGQVRDSDTFCGQTVPGAAVKDGRLVIESAAGPRDLDQAASPWAGISGAAVFSAPERFLLGIVERTPAGYPNNRLKVLPSSVLLADPEFRRLTGEPAAQAVTRSGSVLHPPYQALPANRPDSWLLESRYAVVDFVDEGGQLDTLTEWANSGDGFSIGVVTGGGGTGKSRLAAEFADRLRRAGWDAGLLNTDNPASWDEISSDQPLLIIVDYASRFAEPLAGLIGRLADDNPTDSVRLLLLERRMGSWWETVDRQTSRLARHLLGLDLTMREAERDRHVEAATRSLSRRLGVSPAAVGEIQADRPLLIHVAVLLALRGDPGGSGREALLQRLLDREVIRWEAALGVHKLGHLHPAQAAEIIAVASLVSPHRDEAKALLEGVAPHDAGKVVEWLTDVLGAEDGVIRPVGPDLLVEHLLETLPDLRSVTLRLLAASDTVTATHRGRILHLLTLAARNGPNSRAALTAALTKHLPELLDSDPTSLSAALFAADSTNLALSRAAGQVASSLADSERLAEVRAEIYHLATVRIRKRAGGRISELPDEMIIDDRAAAFADLGGLLVNRGMSLGTLSRWGRALAVTLEAVEIFSVLSEKFGNFADRRRLAIAISHAGKFFRHLGLHCESTRFAKRATRMWRSLAQEDPDQREDLGISLTNLADTICAAGRAGEAIPYGVEGIALFRAELQRGRESSQPHLERALSEMAHHRTEVGDVGDAWAVIHEAAQLKGLVIGETAEVDDVEKLDAVGYLNGRAAELHLRQGHLEQAKACAVLSAGAYAQYAYEFPANLFYFRGSLQLLVEILDAAGDEDDASRIRADMAHLLAEPEPADLDPHLTEFAGFQDVIDAV
ncbi:trypsin-like peptidase domain-containing protein [Actinoplanes sp. NPDC024001]|uniref:trypsin-like peptidase domain-containing protein n=1 Tax=Actinoplanes sp. NPDC024001 TaxID=3154598 RepID=UPI0033EEF717